MLFSELEMEYSHGLLMKQENMNSQEQEVVNSLLNLRTCLQLMPTHAIQFRCSLKFCFHQFVCSYAMRVLHNQSAVSGEQSCAANFLKLRNETRKNAENFLKKSRMISWNNFIPADIVLKGLFKQHNPIKDCLSVHMSMSVFLSRPKKSH